MKFRRLLAAIVVAVCLGAPTAQAQETPSAATTVDTAASQSPDVLINDPPTESPAIPLKVLQASVTGYANGADGGAVGSLTASGVRTHWGTVAADLRLYPLGTRLQIEGFPDVIFIVEDTGGGVRGNIFDVWFPDLTTAVAFGTRTLQVTVLQ